MPADNNLRAILSWGTLRKPLRAPGSFLCPDVFGSEGFFDCSGCFRSMTNAAHVPLVTTAHRHEQEF